MGEQSEIFEKHYNDYIGRIAGIDPAKIAETLGIERTESGVIVRFFNKEYHVSGNGITDADGNRPDYGLCVILAKYLLLCPEIVHHDPEWVSFKDFKKDSHFTNVNFFASDTEQAVVKHFSGKIDALEQAGEQLGGIRYEGDMSYDLSMQFFALPRISLLLLMNDADEEFPAQCKVLFQKHAEYYLDPESLAMTGAALARRLAGAV